MILISRSPFRFLLSFIAFIFFQNSFSQDSPTISPDSLLRRISALEKRLEENKKLYVGGFIHVQWSTSPQAGVQRVGESPNNELNESAYNRIGVRRGRIIASYGENGCQGFLQCDLTEKGVLLVDGFIDVREPWLKIFTLRGGLFSDPFGIEVPFATFNLESIEKSRIIKTLFPDDKDIGVVLTMRPLAPSSLSGVKLETGFLTGNGLGKDADNHKDFVAHLTYTASAHKINYSLGSSLYLGKVINHKGYYSMSGKQFVQAADTSRFADRIYYGLEGQVSRDWLLGKLTLRGEYVFGFQPGTSAKSLSPGICNVVTGDTYERPFAGGYLHLVQDILNTKHTVTLKYDWYDPNTRLHGNEIGTSAFSGAADIFYGTWGFGYLFRVSDHVKLMAYYERVRNETTRNLSGFNQDIKDDVLTLRMQYKF
jgi:Phosphate-selective porin